MFAAVGTGSFFVESIFSRARHGPLLRLSIDRPRLPDDHASC